MATPRPAARKRSAPANARTLHIEVKAQPKAEPGRGLVTFHEGGHVTVEKDGKRQGALERPWPLLWAEHCASLGLEPADYDIVSPSGKRTKIIKQIDGYTWKTSG
jgi:hypothetical protein